MNLDKNKSFCILPFIHLSVVGSKIKPCCRFSPESKLVKKFYNTKKKFTANKILCSEEYDDLRKKMLAGKKIKACYKCYSEEQFGGSSIRQGSYSDFSYLLSSDMTPKLRFLELGFSNLCNLKCRSCSSVLSTAWNEDEMVIKGKYRRSVMDRKEKDINVIKFSDNDLKDLAHVKFVGGEPMLNPEFSQFLKQLSKTRVNKKCIVELFTNVSYFPDRKIINNLVSFKGIRIHLSVDGFDKHNDYLRHPSKWQKVDSVASKWLELRKTNSAISIQLEITVSLYNVLHLEQLLDWWIKKNKQINNDELRIHMIFVFYPKYLSILNIPKKLKIEIVNSLEKLVGKYADYKHIVFWIKNIRLTMKGKGDNRLREFLEFSYDIDEIRDESFCKTFPELNTLLKEYL